MNAARVNNSRNRIGPAPAYSGAGSAAHTGIPSAHTRRDTAPVSPTDSCPESRGLKSLSRSEPSRGQTFAPRAEGEWKSAWRIDAAEFSILCAEVFEDRHYTWRQHPAPDHEAVLWWDLHRRLRCYFREWPPFTPGPEANLGGTAYARKVEQLLESRKVESFDPYEVARNFFAVTSEPATYA